MVRDREAQSDWHMVQLEGARERDHPQDNGFDADEPYGEYDVEQKSRLLARFLEDSVRIS